jgi:hypothetical protein
MQILEQELERLMATIGHQLLCFAVLEVIVVLADGLRCLGEMR